MRALNIVEVKASVLMVLFATFTLYIDPVFLSADIEILNNFYKEKTKQAVSEALQTNPSEAIGNDQIIPEVDLQAWANDYYSFQYTSLGFFAKSLEFIEGSNRVEAEKKIVNLLPRNLRIKAKNYIRATLIICEKYQIDPLWVLSVMWTESHFRPFIESSVGAHGLMQVMPSTRKYLYRQMKRRGEALIVEKEDFMMRQYFNFNIPPKHYKKYVRKLVNIELGVVYLKRLLKRFNYNHKYATVAYNMGPSWTNRRLKKNLPVGNNNQYLSKVMKAYKYLVRRI